MGGHADLAGTHPWLIVQYIVLNASRVANLNHENIFLRYEDLAQASPLA